MIHLRKFGNYVESISKQKLYKQGYMIFVEYWTDNINQQNIITKLNLDDYLYTQKRDKTGLFHVIIYNKKLVA
jgi:hypothetical protein